MKFRACNMVSWHSECGIMCWECTGVCSEFAGVIEETLLLCVISAEGVICSWASSCNSSGSGVTEHDWLSAHDITESRWCDAVGWEHHILFSESILACCLLQFARLCCAVLSLAACVCVCVDRYLPELPGWRGGHIGIGDSAPYLAVVVVASLV